jgi:flagellar motor switch protein FliN/FliY
MTTESGGMNYRAFSNAFLSAFLSALTDASGSEWHRVEVAEAEPPPEDAESAQVKLVFDGSVRGEFLVEFRRADAAIVVSKYLKAPVVEFGAEQSDALVKFIASGTNAIRLELGQQYGTFTINAFSASVATPDRANMVQITTADDNGNRVFIWMYADSTLTEELARHSNALKEDADPIGPVRQAGGQESSKPVNLDLVMDVELNVTLRFGQRQLTLREVLELTSGAVVELDRQVEEPVELLLDGVVIARGEAVVIDGNYGLRVTEVSQPIVSAALR